MEKVYILFECDAWHSTASMNILGVFSSREKMLEAFRGIAQDFIKTGHLDGHVEVEDMVNELDNCRQTQGYATNFTYEEWTLDDFQN